MTLTIAITSDFICPWCLVAETRLNQAIAQLNSAVEIEYLWFPFELNPQMPEAGMDRKAYRTRKFGSWEYSQGLDAKTVQATQADNINFRYDLMTVTPNTLKAHRLTWFAGNQGKATQMAVRILNAYFTEGRNIGDVETLATLAAEIGIDAAQVKAFLESEAGIQEVKDLEQQAMSTTVTEPVLSVAVGEASRREGRSRSAGYAYAQGIHSVPTICIGREIISGAQSVEVFLAALHQAVNELATA
ncbi:MAG: DsbA family oxidoreductase [Nostoc sp.]|uniref:DsbA family oxidoreductase n=1 Tax=Nostoc sp. TaxID=1180 RepID=UPI002FF5C96D